MKHFLSCLSINSCNFLKFSIAPGKGLHFLVIIGCILHFLLLRGYVTCLAQETLRKHLNIMSMKGLVPRYKVTGAHWAVSGKDRSWKLWERAVLSVNQQRPHQMIITGPNYPKPKIPVRYRQEEMYYTLFYKHSILPTLQLACNVLANCVPEIDFWRHVNSYV